MELIDLTHAFKMPMPVYPGDDEPELKQVSFLEGDGVAHFSLTSGMHVGTHIDAPLHFIENSKKISDMPVQTFFGRGRLVDARGEITIHERLLEGMDIKANDIILVWTGKSKEFHQKSYFENFPEITEGFASRLIEKKISMVGMDTCSPDKQPYNIHKLLLEQNILLLENLNNLEKLEGHEFNIIALPLRLDAEASLARVVAGIES